MKKMNKTAKKTFRSDAAQAVHETISGLHRIGLVNKKTMRDFDISCLTEVKDLSPQQITKLREKVGASQALFATCLNVTVGLVSQWERGEKKPGGPSLKLLSLVEKKGLEAVM